MKGLGNINLTLVVYFTVFLSFMLYSFMLNLSAFIEFLMFY